MFGKILIYWRITMLDEILKARKNEYDKQWRKNNAEYLKKYRKEYSKTHKHIREKWHSKNKDRISKYTVAYNKQWRIKNKDKYDRYMKEYKRGWNKRPNAIEIRKKYKIKNRDIILKNLSVYWDKTQFGGNRVKVLERDNYTCQKCNRTHHEVKLIVHHKDGSGRKHKATNNKMNNLVTLCRGCHSKLHNTKAIKALSEKSNTEEGKNDIR
jgi:5-methylcytosine-specific restriction endonuclease McrA